jgi:glycosyltransferase involved in cell wall biosynthesis
MILQCFDHQNYPKERIEWIILDDGTDKIGDLVKGHPNVNYYSYDHKMTIGKKRNLMHTKSTGDIIIYMDDDDYYPPTRISHAVDMLTNSPKLVAGTSEIYVYFNPLSQMWKMGPYNSNHATAATFAFKKELLQITEYNEENCLGEERFFLKSYSIPMVQLNPMHTILVFSHIHNTFDKTTLLENGQNAMTKISNKTVDDFVKESRIKKWFIESMNAELTVYDPGKLEMKLDVLKQITIITEKRRHQLEQHSKNSDEFIMCVSGHVPQKISQQQICEILQQQRQEIIVLTNKLNETYTLLQQEKQKTQHLDL